MISGTMFMFECMDQCQSLPKIYDNILKKNQKDVDRRDFRLPNGYPAKS